MYIYIYILHANMYLQIKNYYNYHPLPTIQSFLSCLLASPTRQYLHSGLLAPPNMLKHHVHGDRRTWKKWPLNLIPSNYLSWVLIHKQSPPSSTAGYVVSNIISIAAVIILQCDVLESYSHLMLFIVLAKLVIALNSTSLLFGATHYNLYREMQSIALLLNASC